MRLFFVIAFNALMLFAIEQLLPGVVFHGGWKFYLAAGVTLGLLNALVRPLLKVLGFPFMILTFGAFVLVINGIILMLLEKILKLLSIAGVSLDFGGIGNFAIAVVIFSLFNIIYGVFLKK